VTEPAFVHESDVERIKDRFTREIEYHEKSEQHLWIAVISHQMTDTLAKRIATGDESVEPLFDQESLRDISFGCYVCEQALDPKLVGKRCPGEPT
jgi:hypothetical protein